MRADKGLRCMVAALIATTATTPASATCSSAQISAWYKDARLAFEQKRYDDSVALLKNAYGCAANPVYLANIARAYEEANRPKDALDAWRAYFAATTDPDERKRTEGRISALGKVVGELDRLDRERQRAETELKLKQTQQSSVQTAPQPSGVSPLAWVTTGIGAAGLTAGLALGLKANGAHSSAARESDVARAEDLQSSARDLATGANVAFVAGATVLAVGVGWIATELLGRRSATPRVGQIFSVPWP